MTRRQGRARVLALAGAVASAASCATAPPPAAGGPDDALHAAMPGDAPTPIRGGTAAPFAAPTPAPVIAPVPAAGAASGSPVGAPASPTNAIASGRVASPPPGAPPGEAACDALSDAGALRRSSLVEVVDGGLGRWLGLVDVEAQVDKGRFRGWVVRRLHPESPCYRKIDIRPGDRVLRVNGRSVERPEHASEIFAALRTARALTVDYVRGAQPRTLRIAIVEDGDAADSPPVKAPK